MIQEFVDRFIGNKSQVEKSLSKHPTEYADLVKIVVEAITTDEHDAIDPDRIHTIDDGDYQGTLLFVIGAKNYQPTTYWAVPVGYGSCSGCDTLESIHEYGGEPPTQDQIKEYMGLLLQIVQELRSIST